MIVKDVIEYIDEIAPFSYGESFDNNGLLVGSMQQSVTKVMVAIDLTVDVLEKAIEDQFDLIITHHPYIFEPIKQITDPILLSLVKNNISYIATHTNYDHGQLRKLFGEKLNVSHVKNIHKGDNGGYFGGIGTLDHEMDVNEYIACIKENFDIPYVRITGEKYDSIKTVAFGNGSLSYYIDEIKNLPCDVYVTGEMKYHDEVTYVNNHCFVISLGHYESEKMFTEDLSEKLTKTFTSLVVVSYNHQMSSII